MSPSRKLASLAARARAASTSTPMSPAVMLVTGLVLVALGFGVLRSLSPENEDPGNRLQVLGLILFAGGVLLALGGVGKAIWGLWTRRSRR